MIDMMKNIKGIINTHLRSIEEIKDRFYTINNILLKIRNLKNNPLCEFKFDLEYEKNRKFLLEKFIKRSK